MKVDHHDALVGIDVYGPFVKSGFPGQGQSYGNQNGPLVSLSSGIAEAVSFIARIKRKLYTLFSEGWDSIMEIGDHSVWNKEEPSVTPRRPSKAKRRKLPFSGRLWSWVSGNASLPTHMK